MIKKEKLGIHKQYLIISAPCEFELISNFGTDKVSRPSGIWQLDCYKLLPEKFQKNYPVFNLELQYDEDKIPSGFTFEYYFSDLNLGDSLKGVSGDLVELSSVQFDNIKEDLDTLKNYTENLIEIKNQSENLTSIDNDLETINTNLLLVKEDNNNNNIQLINSINKKDIESSGLSTVTTSGVTTPEELNELKNIPLEKLIFTLEGNSKVFLALSDILIDSLNSQTQSNPDNTITAIFYIHYYNLFENTTQKITKSIATSVDKNNNQGISMPTFVTYNLYGKKY